MSGRAICSAQRDRPCQITSSVPAMTGVRPLVMAGIDGPAGVRGVRVVAVRERPLSVVQVGFGLWGPSWAQLVARARGFRLAGIVDAGTEARKRAAGHGVPVFRQLDRKSTRLNSSHPTNSYAVVCFKKKKG